jgi:integrase
MGLGSLKDVSLPEARELAAGARKLHKRGVDPKDQRDEERIQSQNETFRDCAEAYIESHKAGWKNTKHISQWTNTLMQYAYPVVGGLSVDMVDTAKIMEVLQPIWNTKTETASRVRGRIENILSWATVQGYREGPNPAMWRGHLSILLPKRSMVQKVIQHAALPYTDLPKLIRKVRISNSISAMALEFTILTCARTNEIIGAQWAEIDMEAAIWTIPPSRMKAGLEHRVALSNQAIFILKWLPQEADWLFLGLKKTRTFPIWLC